MKTSPRICTTVFGFEGGTEIARRHLPLWRAVSEEVCVVFPEDSPCIVADTDLLAHGRSNKYGEACLDRQLFGMRHSLRYSADMFIFVEYDAFLLARPAERSGVQANVFHTMETDFHSQHFLHFPWIFTREALESFAECATFEPFEKGFVDRWLACQLDKIGLPVFDLQDAGEGYSRNTIQSEEEVESVLALVRNGGHAIHGVKSAALLDRILRERKTVG